MAHILDKGFYSSFVLRQVVEVQAGFKLITLLPQPPQCGGYKYIQPLLTQCIHFNIKKMNNLNHQYPIYTSLRNRYLINLVSMKPTQKSPIGTAGTSLKQKRATKVPNQFSRHLTQTIQPRVIRLGLVALTYSPGTWEAEGEGSGVDQHH